MTGDNMLDGPITLLRAVAILDRALTHIGEERRQLEMMTSQRIAQAIKDPRLELDPREQNYKNSPEWQVLGKTGDTLIHARQIVMRILLCEEILNAGVDSVVARGLSNGIFVSPGEATEVAQWIADLVSAEVKKS